MKRLTETFWYAVVAITAAFAIYVAAFDGWARDSALSKSEYTVGQTDNVPNDVTFATSDPDQSLEFPDRRRGVFDRPARKTFVAVQNTVSTSPTLASTNVQTGSTSTSQPATNNGLTVELDPVSDTSVTTPAPGLHDETDLRAPETSSKEENTGKEHLPSEDLLADLPPLDLEDESDPGRKTLATISPEPPLVESRRTMPSPLTSSHKRPNVSNASQKILFTPGKPNYQPIQQPIAPAVVNAFSQKVRYADSLARRGAVSSAFSELQAALILLADALDQMAKTKHRVKCIQNAFVALEEVSDFDSGGQDLSLFVAGHDTPVLYDQDFSRLTIHDARLSYLQYAESNLLTGIGSSPIATPAIRSLGKLFLIQHKFSESQALADAKSMLLLRVATQLSPNDPQSSRQLGVMYAKYNYPAQAKLLLMQSLRAQRDVETWKNLARLHQSLGETRLARLAYNEANMASGKAKRKPLVYWAQPNAFEKIGSMVDPPVMTAKRSYPNTRQANRSDAIRSKQR